MRDQRRSAGRPGEARSRHWLDVDTPGLVQHEWNDGTSVSFRDPTMSFEDARTTAIVAARLATRGAHETFNELKRRMTASNPLRFFLLIDALQRVMRMQGAAAHGYDPLQELVGGILTSLDPEIVMSRRHFEIREDDFTAMELLVRQLAAHASQARVGNFLDDQDDRGLDTRFLLAAEEQFDRTSGYSEHLRVIASDVLTQLDDLEPEIGFRMSDVLRAADAQVEDQVARLALVQARIRQAPQDSETASPASGGFGSLERIASVIGHDPVPVIAASLGVDTSVASRLVDSFATPLGTQEVSSLTWSNRLRQFPAIKFPDGTHLWTSPQDCLHEVLEWADLYLASRGSPSWRQRLSRARAATTERLTAQALANVYGHDRVIRNLEYREKDGGWIEIDALIDLGNAAVIVEAKSQRMTPQGRSATAGRVRTKVEEFLVRPLSQTSRARFALLQGADVRVGRRELPRIAPSVIRRLIVNLDRVDPFVTHARSLVSGTVAGSDGLETDAWIVSLADLLAVTHLLRTPTELWAYHGKRVAQTATGSPVVFMETDALGAWLKSREGAWPSREGHLFQLAFSSQELNAYYNSRDFLSHGAEVEVVPPPTSHIPAEVLSTMTALLDSEWWAGGADAIANVPPAEWGRFRRDVQRLLITPRTRSQRRSLATAERGIAYGVEPRVIIKLGGEPNLEIATAACPPKGRLPNVSDDRAETSVITLSVAPPARHALVGEHRVEVVEEASLDGLVEVQEHLHDVE